MISKVWLNCKDTMMCKVWLYGNEIMMCKVWLNPNEITMYKVRLNCNEITMCKVWLNCNEIMMCNVWLNCKPSQNTIFTQVFCILSPVLFHSDVHQMLHSFRARYKELYPPWVRQYLIQSKFQINCLNLSVRFPGSNLIYVSLCLPCSAGKTLLMN